MIKVVYNRRYGGFSVSQLAAQEYFERTGERLDQYSEAARHDPTLVQIVEELGWRANSPTSELHLLEIPERLVNYYHITDYDGCEVVHVDHAQYKVDMSQAILSDQTIEQCERIARALEILNETLD